MSESAAMIKSFVISVVVAILYHSNPDLTLCLSLPSFFIGIIIKGVTGGSFAEPKDGEASVQRFGNLLFIFGCLCWFPFIGSIVVSVGKIVLTPENIADSDWDSDFDVVRGIAKAQAIFLGLFVLGIFVMWLARTVPFAQSTTWFRKGGSTLGVQSPRAASELLRSDLQHQNASAFTHGSKRQNLFLSLAGLIVFGGSMFLIGNVWGVAGMFPCRSWYAVLWQGLASFTILSGSWLASTLNEYHLDQGGEQDEEVLSRVSFFLGLAGICLLINVVYTACWKVPMNGWPK